MGAGLGMRGTKVQIDETDNYKDALKKTLFARYNELDWYWMLQVMRILFIKITSKMWEEVNEKICTLSHRH